MTAITRRAALAAVPAIAATGVLPAVSAFAAVEQDPHPKWWAERQAWRRTMLAISDEIDRREAALPAAVKGRPKVCVGYLLHWHAGRQPNWAYSESVIAINRAQNTSPPLGVKTKTRIAAMHKHFDGLLADFRGQVARREAACEQAGITRLDAEFDQHSDRAAALERLIRDTEARTAAGLAVQLRLLEFQATTDEIDPEDVGHIAAGLERLASGGAL